MFRVLYFGTPGQFSSAPLSMLIRAGFAVCGVVAPMARGRDASPSKPITLLRRPWQPSQLPIINPHLNRSIVHLAWEHEIPVFEVGQLGAAPTLARLAEMQPDVACVACFPKRIPASLLALPGLGFLNVHPSLLPAYRGPVPLFWSFRNGERSTGVTIHFMDESLDTGDIALQAPVEWPDGISGPEADRICSTVGGQLLVEALQALQRGRLQRHKQPSGGSYYAWPTADDFILGADWPAQRAFNFMRGTAEWGMPYVVHAGAQRLVLGVALSYTADDVLGAPYIQLSDEEVCIQFMPGTLRARVLQYEI